MKQLRFGRWHSAPFISYGNYDKTEQELQRQPTDEELQEQLHNKQEKELNEHRENRPIT
jgi:hypothetical protein